MLLLSTCSQIVFLLTGISPNNGFHTAIEWSAIQMVPLQGIKTVLYHGITFYAIENILGNIVMMIPIGFMLPMFFRNLRKWYFVGLIGGAVSLLIEISQLFLWRGTDVDDVLLNLTGTIAGYLIWKCFGRKADERIGLAESDKRWNVLWLCTLLVPYSTELVLGFVDLFIRLY